MTHSRWASYGGPTMAHGEHKGYVPGGFDPTTGITNPDRKGYVRSWRHPDSISGPGGLLAQLQEFTGHSIRAIWIDGAYRVYSYNVEIARWTAPRYNPNDPGRDLPEFTMDDDYYSHKTREHQSMIAAWMGQAVEPVLAPAIR